jgi:hypothetical protein
LILKVTKVKKLYGLVLMSKSYDIESQLREVLNDINIITDTYETFDDDHYENDMDWVYPLQKDLEHALENLSVNR